MITLQLTERQARYIHYVVQNDLEVLTKGDFNDDDSDEERDAKSVLAMIDAALLLAREETISKRARFGGTVILARLDAGHSQEATR